MNAQVVFSGLYSEPFFVAHRNEFFAAVSAFFWLNWSLLWRLYSIVIVVSIGLILMIKFYGPIRRSLVRHERLQSFLAIVVLPRVSDWHVLLSHMLLPSADVRLFVDILTRSDQLYQGRLSDKTLGADGSLVNVTLAEPTKFRRDRYLEALKSDPHLSADGFWNKIPGEIFVVMADEITTLNIRYVPQITRETAPEVIDTLRSILARLESSQS